MNGEAKSALLSLAQDHDPVRRLHALWTLQAVGLFSDDVAIRSMSDPDEYVRAWTVQLLTDNRRASLESRQEFVRRAKSDASPVMRLYLASAIQRLPAETAWNLIEALAQHAEDREDRNLPLLLWDGLAQRMHDSLDRAFLVADTTKIPQLADFIYWYAATFETTGLDRSIASLAQTAEVDLARRLAGLWLAMEPRANLPMPAIWKKIAPSLYESKDIHVRRLAEKLAAVFGDDSMFPRLRQTLADSSADAESRKHAFAVLDRSRDRESLSVLLPLLDDAAFRTKAINSLSRFDTPAVSEALITGFAKLSATERSLTLNTLCSRSSFALALLDAVTRGTIKRDQLTAFHIRQLTELHNTEVDQRIATTWGRILQSPAAKQAEIERLEKTFDEAPLWAYSANEGHVHFQKLCAQCHRIGNDGMRLGPELTGAGNSGIRYFHENIIDPNAVIGADFQMTVIDTKNGETVSGLIAAESPTALTLRTAAGELIIAKADIAKRTASDKSLMPEGLLEALGDREQLELLKFLTSN